MTETKLDFLKLNFQLLMKMNNFYMFQWISPFSSRATLSRLQDNRFWQQERTVIWPQWQLGVFPSTS